MLLEPGGDDLDVEDCAVGGADRVLEGLEGGGAEVEGQAAEGDLGGVGAGGIGADAGGEGVCGVPFGVGDLEEKRWESVPIQYGLGLVLRRNRREERSVHRVYRYLFPWLPIDIKTNMLYKQIENKEIEGLCSVYVCNWWIGGLFKVF